jgi:hypothetical protein
MQKQEAITYQIDLNEVLTPCSTGIYKLSMEQCKAITFALYDKMKYR